MLAELRIFFNPGQYEHIQSSSILATVLSYQYINS